MRKSVLLLWLELVPIAASVSGFALLINRRESCMTWCVGESRIPPG